MSWRSSPGAAPAGAGARAAAYLVEPVQRDDDAGQEPGLADEHEAARVGGHVPVRVVRVARPGRTHEHHVPLAHPERGAGRDGDGEQRVARAEIDAATVRGP